MPPLLSLSPTATATATPALLPLHFHLLLPLSVLNYLVTKTEQNP
ncbi:hypothetical protein OIU77_000423 [Salix suchowensis]|uniref:Photosystem I subunit VIII n=1 Tax=Salix suchowensis TaxID=1278906 RepID=A0ABQ9B7I7_9ROSI|nr:hypothetical protein OIU77_000423 [Salix suchowensis]